MTPKLLKTLLTYDPETGVFTRNGRVAGTVMKPGYRRIGVNKRYYLAHRLAWFYVYEQWPDGEIDHINRAKDDNRISNLRIATRSQQRQNTAAKNPTGFRGVKKHGNKWRADIKIPDGKKTYLGLFSTPEEAHEAYCEAAKNHFGPFAVP